MTARGSFDQNSVKGNIVEQVATLTRRVSTLETREASGVLYQLGDIVGPAFICPVDPTIADPSDPAFSGSFMSALGMTFGGSVYHVGGINAGALQWGGKSTDGKFYTGGGEVTLDVDGITITGKDTPGNPNKIRWLGGAGAVAYIYASNTLGDIYIVPGSGGNGQGDLYLGSSSASINILGDLIAAARIYLGKQAATIASDTITVTASYVTLETEGGAATDNLSTINGGSDGMVIVIRDVNGAHDVTVKDGTGNLSLAGDCVLGTIRDMLTLLFNAGQNGWCEISRSING